VQVKKEGAKVGSLVFDKRIVSFLAVLRLS
jgi:hypothetical protein